MNHILSPLNNENGAALFVAVLVMLIATMVGYFALQNTNIEMKVAGNQRIYQRAFYRADAAAMEGAQRLYNEANANPENLREPALYPRDIDPVTGTPQQWFYGTPDTSNLEDPINWVSNGGVYGFNSDVDPNDPADPNPAFAVAYQGIAPGAQWELGQPTMRVLAIFSLDDRLKSRDQVLLNTGFLGKS